MALQVRTKMGKAIVTIKIMPESPEVDLAVVQKAAEEKIDSFTGVPTQKEIEIEPIAFGLKAVKIVYVMDEDKGSTESLEQDIQTIEGVQSVDTIDVRRALG